MPTWLTGLLVAVRMARSASERPRKSQTSPVEAPATASSKESGTGLNLRIVRVPWKLIGVAGLAGVAATGAVVARRRRAQSDLDADELRDRLHERLAEVEDPEDRRGLSAGPSL